jgi:tRNA dimethylallyltransferase
MTTPVIAIVGPTAAGKSALSIALAHALDGEVINADSMQLYRGMDIGTAKLTRGEQDGVPHHVLSIWDVREPASVATYQTLARAAIDDILARGRVPILVGGTGLYVRAVLERFEFPGTDPAVREALHDDLIAHGPAELHARLAAADPAAAAKILPSNGRRIVRALEVIELTGEPFTAALPEPIPVYDAVEIGVDVDTAVLDQRIAARVEAMWALGFVAEVEALVRTGLRDGLTASRALGYQQVLAYLDGAYGEDQAAVETVAATRRLGRKQRKWFRRDHRIEWIDGADPAFVGRALAAVRDGSGGPRDHRAARSSQAGAPADGSVGPVWDGLADRPADGENGSL